MQLPKSIQQNAFSVRSCPKLHVGCERDIKLEYKQPEQLQLVRGLLGGAQKQSRAGSAQSGQYRTIVELGSLSWPNKWYQSEVGTVRNNLKWAPERA